MPPPLAAARACYHCPIASAVSVSAPAGLPLSPDAIDRDAYRRLAAACGAHRFLPTFCHGLLLQVAMPDPDDEAALAAIRRLTHQEVRPYGVRRTDFEAVLAALACDSPAAASASAPSSSGLAWPPQAWPGAEVPARKLAVEMVAYAFALGASDLLLDDQEEWLDVAVKRSGLKEILPPLDRARSAGLFRAFKEIAGLSTQTVLTWQTGAARLALPGGGRTDLRIEVTPTVHGESLVARLQDRAAQTRRMAEFPLTDPAQRAEVLACLARSQGLIVATGPTGQGKTTTLYACLGQLDRSRLNIRTLEDPVEFPVPWITQIPVGAGTGRDFAGGLRSLLRQAPHVILLGELRDRAAAQTCMEAVDTGHLLLATLHTRDAVGVVSRLLDLGLTGRQIAAGLRLAIAQRLLRRLCERCREPHAPTPGAERHFQTHGLPRPERLWAARGCAACGFRGETGVVPVFELFRPGVREEVEEAVARADLARFSERDLRRRWTEAGGEPMVRSALRLAAAGTVAYAEAAALENEIGALAMVEHAPRLGA